MSNSFYLVSDTHGYIPAFRSLDKLATVDKKAYILGDLFDHYFGEEKEILNYIVNMLNEDRAVFIMGNHDFGLYNLLFPSNTYVSKLNLLKHSSRVILKVVRGLYSQRVFDLLDKFLTEFKKTQDMSKYIDNVSYLIEDEEFRRITDNLKYLYKDAKYFVELNILSKKILLTHSGDKKDLYSNEIITHNYHNEYEYDFAFMGHVTTSHLASNLRKVQEPLPLNNFIRNKHNIPDIIVKSTYSYNQKYNTFMIDNGSHNNIVEVTVLK